LPSSLYPSCPSFLLKIEREGPAAEPRGDIRSLDVIEQEREDHPEPPSTKHAAENPKELSQWDPVGALSASFLAFAVSEPTALLWSVNHLF